MDRSVLNVAWLAKHHFGVVRLACFVTCLGPALWLTGEWLGSRLGINPLNRLQHFTGLWSLIMLTITMSVSPARRFSVWVSRTVHARYGKRVSDWNWLIRLRRQFGLFTFFYACLHLVIYVAFDVGFDLPSLLDDLRERPFIAIGFIAYVLLIPLAATSNQFAMKALGRCWRRLHLLSYLIGMLAITHFWLLAKVGDTKALPYSLVMALLLTVRFRAWLLGDRDFGVEEKERLNAKTPCQSL
jgi:methionine sulfoxide reductase heme-binding subunit